MTGMTPPSINDKSELWLPSSLEVQIALSIDGESQPLRLRLLKDGLTLREVDKSYDHPNPLFWRLFIFEGGGAKLEMDGQNFELQPHTLYWIPRRPFRIHYRPSKLRFFHIDLSGRSGAPLMRQPHGPVPLPKMDPTRLLPHLKGVNAQLAGALLEVAEMLLEQCQSLLLKQNLDNLDNLYYWIDQAPPAQLRVEDLAQHMNLERTVLSKRFRRQTGESLKAYLIDYHIRQASELLLGSNLPIASVARRLGHASASAFQRFFKAQLGVSPGRYRQTDMKD